jgi:pimeloyl-ACP methyl ester carboxylesterase
MTDSAAPSSPAVSPRRKTIRHVVFAHGLESGPWGRKITALAPIATAEGYQVDSVDFRGMDDPAARVTRLVDACQDKTGDLILVGSSLGAWVVTAAAGALHARGLFLMAPAFYMPQLPPLRAARIDCPTAVVHGWDDAVIPYQNSLRFAAEQKAALHLIPGDHGLHMQIPTLKSLFEYFLISFELSGDRAGR